MLTLFDENLWLAVQAAEVSWACVVVKVRLDIGIADKFVGACVIAELVTSWEDLHVVKVSGHDASHWLLLSLLLLKIEHW